MLTISVYLHKKVNNALARGTFYGIRENLKNNLKTRLNTNLKLS